MNGAAIFCTPTNTGTPLRRLARLVPAIAAHRANGGAVLLASHFALAIDELAELDMGALV